MIIKFFLFYFIIQSTSFAETISGYVYDSKTTKPISSVNIFIASQHIGVASRDDGSFTLNFSPKDEVVLEVSHIAYSSKKNFPK